jgi:hypothetical protein
MLLQTPEKLSWRPYTKGGLPIPYNSHISQEGLIEWATADQEKWFECVKHGRCAYCGMDLDYWIYFLVANEQLEKLGGKYFFTDPAMHKECVDYMWTVMQSLIRNNAQYRHKSYWAIYQTRSYRLATLTPPLEARATGAASLVRINPAPPKDIQMLMV